jgi:hypothetical protein
MRMDRREGQRLNLVQLLIFAFHLHQLLVRPTLHQTSIPEAPVQSENNVSARQERSGVAWRGVGVGSQKISEWPRNTELSCLCPYPCTRARVRVRVRTTYRIKSACFARWPNRCVIKMRVRPSRSRRRERMPSLMEGGGGGFVRTNDKRTNDAIE